MSKAIIFSTFRFLTRVLSYSINLTSRKRWNILKRGKDIDYQGIVFERRCDKLAGPHHIFRELNEKVGAEHLFATIKKNTFKVNKFE